MPKKKSGLTLEAHRSNGLFVSAARNELLTILVETSKGYPKTAVSKLNQSLRLLDEWRSEMDDIIHREHRDLQDGEAAHVYYPPIEEVRRLR